MARHDLTWLVMHNTCIISCYTDRPQPARICGVTATMHAFMTHQDLWALSRSVTLKYTRTGNLFHQNSQLVNESYAHLFCPPTNLFSDLFDLINTSRASSSNTNCTLDACVSKHTVWHLIKTKVWCQRHTWCQHGYNKLYCGLQTCCSNTVQLILRCAGVTVSPEKQGKLQGILWFLLGPNCLQLQRDQWCLQCTLRWVPAGNNAATACSNASVVTSASRDTTSGLYQGDTDRYLKVAAQQSCM